MEEALAEFMGIQQEEIKKEIDQVYRRGNAFIKRNNLSREVHLKCVRQKFQGEIIRKLNP